MSDSKPTVYNAENRNVEPPRRPEKWQINIP